MTTGQLLIRRLVNKTTSLAVMSSKLALLCVIIVFCIYNVEFTRAKGYYTIVAPGTLRSQSVYQVSISLSDFPQPCLFEITIEPNKTTQFQQPNEITETVEVNPGTTKLLEIPMPQLNYGIGRLIVNVNSGIIARKISQIYIDDLHYTVYIQTDKAKYKPGEVLQFRVICIDRLTRPAIVNENIVDGQRNLIKEISNVKLVQGVFKSELQISEYPVLGEWTIEVKANGRAMRERSVQVARYILPSFSVDIFTKKDVALDEGQIVMRVKASYTYGEPLKGNLTVLVHTIYSAVGGVHQNIMKQSQIDGESTLTLRFGADLNINQKPNDHLTKILYTFGIEARVQDALTTRYSEKKVEISVHNHPYKIGIDIPKSFDTDKLFNISVSVTDLANNPIQDKENPVRITIEGSGYKTVTPPQETEPKIIDVYLNENGIGDASLSFPDDGWNAYKIIAEYLGWSSHPEKIEKNENAFNLDILTERPAVGEELVIQLRSVEPIEYFVYEIISRGEILQSERIEVPGNETTCHLRINATHLMVPKVTLYIHRVTGKTFDSRLKEVYIKRAFRNSIKVRADDEVHPGALVSVNVTTDEGSYVGLMGVDKKLLLEPNNPDELSEDHIFTDLRNYDLLNMNAQRFPGIQAGLVTFSNAENRDGFEIGEDFSYHIAEGEVVEHPLPESFDKPSVELPHIRKLFAESWIFKDFERTTGEGFRLRETIPDSITSWAISGFSLNPNTGLALTKTVTTLKVFQKFFISMELPHLIKEGEIIEIPVYLFNYMDQNLLSDVTIGSASSGLEFLDNINVGGKLQTNKTISKSIPAQGKVKLVFLARSHKSGSYDVNVKAIAHKASDAIQKTLTVAPEGVPYSFSKTYMVHFLQETEQEDTISIDIPENAVLDSETVQLSVIGDVFGPLMRSLQKLVRVPYGNGEDNIRYFVSNLLVLKYLKTLNHSNPSLENKAKLHLELGYQNQLAFKHLDGSFSFFDRSVGYTGDIWLTAYALWGLQQAKEFIAVDTEVIDRGLKYLRSKQKENGVLSSGEGAENDVALTAFAILSFLVDEINEWKHADVITKGLSYLYNALDGLEESIPMVVSKYALVLGKHEKSEEIRSNLSNHARFTTGKHIMWSKADNLQSNLETTAASFINLLDSQQKPTESLLAVVRALISAKDNTKIPTQMIALEAMIHFARNMDLGRKDLNIHFNDSQGVSDDLRVNTSNAQILQTAMLSKTSRNVHLKTKGSGFAIVNIKYTYNVLPESQSLSNYQTNIKIKESTDFMIAFEVCTAIRSIRIQSNLTAMEVNLQSGYIFDGKCFNQFQKINGQISSIHFNGNQGSVLIYVQDVTENSTCILLEAFKSHSVFNSKPASVIVYDVHKEDEKSISFFGKNLSKEFPANNKASS